MNNAMEQTIQVSQKKRFSRDSVNYPLKQGGGMLTGE
jgi:hypothetical protein